MRKLNKKIQIGTLVKIAGFSDFVEVESISYDRLHFKIKGYVGSWQEGHVQKYTNKAKLKQTDTAA